jgi:hypothetical protein
MIERRIRQEISMLDSDVRGMNLQSQLPSKEDNDSEVFDGGNNLVGWFFDYNRSKGRAIKIPKLGISINADGTIENIPVV